MKASWLDLKVIHNDRVTFLAEKLLGIFSGQYEFAWDGPQQFNDQSNVVYHHTQSVSSREGGGEVEGRTKQWTTWSDSVNTVIHPSWEKGDKREGKETQLCPGSTDSGHTVKNFQIKDCKKKWTCVKQKSVFQLRLPLVELQALSCHTSAALKLQQFIYCADGWLLRRAFLKTTEHFLRKIFSQTFRKLSVTQGCAVNRAAGISSLSLSPFPQGRALPDWQAYLSGWNIPVKISRSKHNDGGYAPKAQ